MSKPWAKAVGRAGTYADSGEAIRQEQENLWTDLAGAIPQTIHPEYGLSMQCDWLIERIVPLARLAGPTHWRSVPGTLLKDGTYQGILRSAGIAFEQPDLAEVRQLERATS